MAPRNRPHIIVARRPETDPYTSHVSGRDSPRPAVPIDRFGHGIALARAAEAAQDAGRARRRQVGELLGIAPASNGIYVVFDSTPGFDLVLKTLDPQSAGDQPELVAVQQVVAAGQPVERATVFVPDGKLGYFIKRFEEYASQDTRTGKPKNASFVERVASVRLATIEALWTDDPNDFPAADSIMWWEVWLRHRDGGELDRLTALGERLGIRVGERHLVFDDRTIVLVWATATQLGSAIDLLDDLAELRRARLTAEFLVGAGPAEQAEWVKDLADRTEPAEDGAPAVCVLDTGVNRVHPLLAASLDPEDTHACEPGWGTHDDDGHGTGQAGLSLYGSLLAAFEAPGPVRLRHRLESVKMLPPPPGENEPDLYGAVTADAVHRVEIQAPTRRRAFSMAITADSDGIPGTPTSWSSALDALAIGRAFETEDGELKYLDESSVDDHRLFIVSAGNVREFDGDEAHLDRSDVEPVEDPAQAWNVLTVGAYTELVDIAASGDDFADWTPTASPGELSPFSRTSVAFPHQWPIKPEIVMEGGNTARSPSGDIDWPDSLQLLTTHHEPARRMLTTSNATSAATAQASQLTAVISAEYPSLWPETTRALLVHSAEWTPAMRARLTAPGTGRRDREALVRRYGFGVPSERDPVSWTRGYARFGCPWSWRHLSAYSAGVRCPRPP
ncbi:MAG: S8 family peptidase [Desertimonas sp.]